MTIRAAIFSALLLATPASALAQGPSTDPASAPAGTYAIDKSHTRISWRISHLGTSYYVGWFAKFDASLTFDPAAPEKSVLKASVDTSSVTTLDPEFDKEIASDKFLDASKTATITFDSTTVEKTGANTGKVTGNLTLHGVTKPISFDVTFVGGMMSPMKKAHAIGFQAVGKFKRSDFGITEYINFGLGDEITVIVDTEFDKTS